MKTLTRIPAFALALMIGTGAVTAPIAASADGRTDRAVAIGLTAAAAALLAPRHDACAPVVVTGDRCDDHPAFVRTGYVDRGRFDRDNRDHDRRDDGRRDRR